MLSQLLSRALMVIVLMQFKQNLGASTLDPLLTVNTALQQNQPLATDIIPIRHSRSRVHRHLHGLGGGGLSATTNESFVSVGAPINNAQLPFNYANDYQKASIPGKSFAVENSKLPSNLTHATTTTMTAGETTTSVTHKIRKLHKKQLIENMRNTVRHRSLMQAEQLFEKQTTKIPNKTIKSPDDENFMYFNDQSYSHSNWTPKTIFESFETPTTIKPLKNRINTITKLYRVDDYDKKEANKKLAAQKGMITTQIAVEDQQSISAVDLNDLREIVGEDENKNIENDRNFSLLEQRNETDSSELSVVYTDGRTYSSPQTIKAEGQNEIEKQIQSKEDLTLDFMWNENDTYAPSMFASTSLGGEIAERQHKSALFDLPENNLKGITLVDKAEEATTDYTLVDNRHANGFPLESDDSGLSVVGEDEEPMEANQLLEGVIDAANEDEIYDWDEISRNNRRNLMRGRDVVTKFLQIVETQHSLGSNCEAGTSLNLGEGVVDRYAQDRFRVEAEVAVNRANMLTRYILHET